MLAWMNPFFMWLNRLSSTQRLIAYAIWCSLLGLFLIILVLWQFSAARYFSGQMQKINQERKKTQAILQQQAEVLRHKAMVQQLLGEDENFYLSQFIAQAMMRVGVQNRQAQEGARAVKIIADGYQEQEVRLSFNGLSLVEVMRLVQELTASARVWIKELKMTKSKKGTMLDATIIVATVERATS